MVMVKLNKSMSVEVLPGQIWKDNDPRGTQERRIKVESIKGKIATVTNVTTGKKTKISLKRFNPNVQTGYTRVIEAAAAPATPGPVAPPPAAVAPAATPVPAAPESCSDASCGSAEHGQVKRASEA